MRSPVATSSMPPTALKSASIIGVVSGIMIAAQAARVSWISSIGTLMAATAMPEGAGEDGGGEKVEKRFGNQNAGVAGHPFAHGAEDAGAAGAEQDDNRHIALNIRLMSRSLFLAFSLTSTAGVY